MRYLSFLLILTASLAFADVGGGSGPYPPQQRTEWVEVDGSPSLYPYKIVVSPDSISGSGVMSLDIVNRTALGSTTSTSAGCSLVGIPTLAGATWTHQCHFNNLFGSAGRATGGAITDAGSETINVASGTGFIKKTDDDTAELLSCVWSASNGISVPTNTVLYVGVEYDSVSGNAQVKTQATQTWNLDTEFPLGSVINQAGTLYTMNDYWWVTDGMTNIIERFQSQGTVRDNFTGGLIIGTSSTNTTRKPTLTAGTVWSRLNEFAITAKDCSAGSTFYGFYRDGGTGWSRTAAKTDIDDFYDNNSGTLQPLDNNKFVNFWIFVEVDTVNSGQLMVIYPQTQYNTAAEAEAGALPAFPSVWYKHGILVGRIIIKQGVTAPISVKTAFGTTFGYALAASHPNLSNLTWANAGHTGDLDNGAGNITTAGQIYSSGAKTSGVDIWNLRGGNFVIQSAGDTNGFLFSNAYYSSTAPAGTKALADGQIVGFQFYNGNLAFRHNASILAGENVTGATFKQSQVNYEDHTVAIGGNPSITTALPAADSTTFLVRTTTPDTLSTMVLKEVSGQTTKLLEIRDSDSNILGSIDVDGNITTSGDVTAGYLRVNQDAAAVGLYVTGGGSGNSMAKFERDVGTTGPIFEISGGNSDIYAIWTKGSVSWAMGIDDSEDVLAIHRGATLSATPVFTISESANYDVSLPNDSQKLLFGAGASIYFDATDLVFTSASNTIKLGTSGTYTLSTTSGGSALYALTLSRVAGDGSSLTTQGHVNIDSNSFGVLLGEGQDGQVIHNGSGMIVQSDLITATDYLQLRGGTNGIAFNIGATEEATLTATTLDLKTNAITTTGDITSQELKSITEAAVGDRGVSIYQNNAGVHSPLLNFYKSRGTNASPAAAASGDYLGVAFYRGYDGDEYLYNGIFGAVVTGAVGNNDIPTKMFFGVDNAGISDPYGAGPTPQLEIEETEVTVNADLTVTGTLGAGEITGTSLTDGTATLDDGSITSAVNGTFSGTVQAEQLTSTDDADVADKLTVNHIGEHTGSHGVVIDNTLTVPNTTFISGQKWSRSFIISYPTASSDSPLWRCPVAATITAIHVIKAGGTNIVGQLWEYDANGLNGATVDSSNITCTGNNVNDDGTLSNPSIDAGDYVGWKTVSVSGTVTYAVITYEGYWN